MFRTITLFALISALIVLTLITLLALRDWARDFPGIQAAATHSVVERFA